MVVSLDKQSLDRVITNLNKEISKINGNVQNGLTLGMLMVKADSMSATPVDTGNLRGSHYLVSGDGKVDRSSTFVTKKSKSGERVSKEHEDHIRSASSNAQSKKGPFCEIGCTAFYAVYVHENLEAKHVTGKAKFMEDAIKSNYSKLLDAVKRFAKT